MDGSMDGCMAGYVDCCMGECIDECRLMNAWVDSGIKG